MSLEPDARFSGKDTCKKEKIHSTSDRTRIGNSTSTQVISKRKVKVKFTLEQTTKVQRGSGGIALLFL
jgi:hypothetical protein